MRKRTLASYWILVLIALFAAYYVGLPVGVGDQAKVVEEYQNPILEAAQGSLPAMVGDAIYLGVVPLVLVLLAGWQFRALVRAGKRDGFIWWTSVLTSLVITAGLFFAFTHHTDSMYGVKAKNIVLAEGLKKAQSGVQALKGQPLPQKDGYIDIKALLKVDYAYCPGAPGDGTCNWQMRVVQEANAQGVLEDKVDFVNFTDLQAVNPAFADLTTARGIGVWLGWLAVLLGMAANLYLWAAKLGEERIGVDLIYDQGVSAR